MNCGPQRHNKSSLRSRRKAQRGSGDSRSNDGATYISSPFVAVISAPQGALGMAFGGRGVKAERLQPEA
jgi:hypothetical protein